jgi:carboxypeptidase D
MLDRTPEPATLLTTLMRPPLRSAFLPSRAGVVLAVCVLSSLTALGRERLAAVCVPARDEYVRLRELGLDVTAATDSVVRGYADETALARIQAAGYRLELLNDSCPPCQHEFYHTYQQVRDSLRALVLRRPDICRLETLGYSVQNRLLLGLRVSDNINVRENEPRVRFDGNIHGPEKLGCELVMFLAYTLADSYGISPRLTALVNDLEIMLIPMVNPDGATANQRQNANGVDLNRDYGYMWNAWGASPDWFSQPETRAQRRDCEQHEYCLSLSFHCGAELVVYPWGYTPVGTQDRLLFQQLVAAYGASAGYDTSNMYRWYQVCGVSFDARYGLNGTPEITTEIAWNGAPPDSVEYYCLRNKEAMLQFMARARAGIHGTITDATSGEPVQALVRIGPPPVAQRWFLYSSRENGDFHRPALPGTYTLSFWAPGYSETTFAGVVVPDTVTPVLLDAALRRDTGFAAKRLVCVQQNDTAARQNVTLTHLALGPADTRVYSMSFGGRLVLDMGAGTEIVDGPGPDFVVVEHPSANDTIVVAVADSWCGPWTTLPLGIGTCSLDLASRGVAQARYVLIRDANRRPNSQPGAGYDLDAVVALNHNSGIAEIASREVSVQRPGTTFIRDVLFLPVSPFTPSSSLFDLSGRPVVSLVPGPNDVRHLPAGVYFLRCSGTAGRVVKVR